MDQSNKIQRVEKANKLIKIISLYGRRFFWNKNDNAISFFKIKKGRVYFVDHYSKKEIYLHYRYWSKGFSNGGTLRSLIDALKDWIIGKRANPPLRLLGPWPKSLCNGDLWGYGSEMKKVRAKGDLLFN